MRLMPFDHLRQDVRYGLRVLGRNPGFTAAAVLTLALAISATTATFSVVDAVLLQPPPFPDPDRLVTVWETDPENGGRPADPSPANFLDWREQAASFEHVAALDPYSVDLTGDGEPEVIYAWQVTEGFFEALGAPAARGRTFLPDDHRPDRGVVVMTDGLWRRRFDGDPGVVGRPLVLDGRPHTVVGVLPPGFELRVESGRGDRDLFLPKAVAEYERHIRGGGWWRVIARTRPGVTLAEAQAEMDTVAGRLAAAHPRTNAGVGARLVPLRTRQVEAVRPVLLLLQGAAVFVLLIACVNVANLMLARYARREHEFAVRAAVGGGPGRLLGQLFTESVVIAAAGGLCGGDRGRHAQRTGEIGLRLAIGAERRDVVWMVVRGALGLAGAGVAIGLLAALLLVRTLASLLFDVAPFDVATLAAVALLLLGVAAAAAWFPARRASRVNPLAALRTGE